MRHRFAAFRHLNALKLVALCFSAGYKICLRNLLVLLGLAAEAVTPDPSNVLQIFRFLISLFIDLAFLTYFISVLRFLCASTIKSHIRQVVNKASSHKISNEFCEEEVSERTDDVDKLVGFVLRFFHNLGGGLFAVSFIAMVLMARCLSVWVVLLLIIVFILMVFFVKASFYWYKRNFCSSDSRSTNLNSSEDMEDSCNHHRKRQKFKRCIQILIQTGKEAIVEFDDIVCKFLPILTTVFLVFWGVFSFKSLAFNVALCCGLLDILCDIGKTFFTFPEVKEYIKTIKGKTGDDKPSSMSDWRYMYQLFTGTGRFGNLKEY